MVTSAQARPDSWPSASSAGGPYPRRVSGRTVRSSQDLKFFHITSYDRPPQYLGFTSSKLDNFVAVPSGESWFVRPDGCMSAQGYLQLIDEIKERRFPGLDVSDRWDVTNQTLAALAGVKSLRILRLSDTRITDAGLGILEKLPDLEVLVLNNQVTNSGLRRIRGLKRLKALDLQRARITDSGLGVLKSLPGLVRLDVSDTRITDAGAKRIAALASLRQLDISGTEITDKGIAWLAGLPKLEVLYVGDKMTDRGLRAVTGFKRLKSLDVSGAKITDAGAGHLRGATRLEALALSETSIGDATLEQVATLKYLKTLELSGTRVTREGLSALAGMPRLETLSLGWGELTAAELRALGDLPRLTRVILNGRTLGQEVLSRIRSLAKLSKPGRRKGVRPERRATAGLPAGQAGVAPTTHPGGKAGTHVSLQDAPVYGIGAAPKPVRVGTAPKGKPLMIEVGASPQRARAGGTRKLTGLKRLHQIELGQAPRDLELRPGAFPQINFPEQDPANSLGELNVNTR